MEKKKPGPKQTNGSQCKRCGRQRRGRKPASESRATEIRATLAGWKQISEASRPSLRALAAELGVSHQLLSFYLTHWDRWQAKEYKRKANDICARTKSENRAITGEDQAQIVANLRAYIQLTVVSDLLAALRKEAMCGKLSRRHMRTAKLLADRGYGGEIEKIFAIAAEQA
jgi:hypothetical protein